MPASTMAVDHRQIFACGRLGLGQRGDVLTEMIERDEQASRFDRAGGGDGVRDRLAGDEPARKAGRLAHPDAGGEAL